MKLPETFNDGWHEEMQYLWLERETLRLVFDNELDSLYDTKYTNMLLIKNLHQPEIHEINLFSTSSDVKMWREDVDDSDGFYHWRKDHELLDDGPQPSPALVNVLEVFAPSNHDSSRVKA